MAVFSVVGLLSVLAVANVVYLFGLAIYRLRFHPLAKHPGPFFAKLSQWPESRSTWRGRRHIDLHLLHEQYGDIVRFSPNKLSFRTPGALHDIYTDRRANCVKAGWTEAGLRINPGITTHVLSDRKLHAARRRLLNQAFSESALKNLEKYVLERIRVWCDYLGAPKEGSENEKKEGDGWGKERDMGAWSTLLTVDVLGELSFGSSFGAMQAGYSYIMELLMSSAKFQTIIAFLPLREVLYPLLSRPSLLLKTGNKTIQQKVQYRQNIASLVEKRFALEKVNSEKPIEDQRKDFFHYLLHAKDPETGDKFLPKDLVGEAALLVGAGSDTSSTAMSACFFYLMRCPRAFKKLQSEIHNAFNEVEEIRYTSKLTSLPYLRACIDEAMRMSPPVPTLLDRRVLPGGIVIDGATYPQDIVVGVPIYAIHHSEKYFPRSFEFIPERWILPGKEGHAASQLAGESESESESEVPIEVTPESINLAKSAFHAFSSGPRGCVGKNLAYMELLVAISRVVLLFDVRLKQGDTSGEGGTDMALRTGKGRENRAEYQLEDWLISKREGPVLEFRHRAV